MNVAKYSFLRNLSRKTAPLPVIAAAREEFLHSGVATFPDFLVPSAIKKAVTECEIEKGVTKPCFVTDDTHNAYLLPDDPSFPPTHVRNKRMSTKVASIAADELPQRGVLMDLYNDDRLRELIRRVVYGEDGEKEIHKSADPIGCCSVNVFKSGWLHSHHFDESEFSTTLMLQRPESGGMFEFTERIRSSQDEFQFSTVEDVIAHQDDQKNMKTSTKVSTLAFEPGTLSIFAGRYSLHRVTPCEGEVDRLVSVLTFANTEGYKNSPQVQKLFWGRTSE